MKDHERTRLWLSLKQRLSSSRRANTGDANLDEKRGDKIQSRTQRSTADKAQPTRFSRMKNDRTTRTKPRTGGPTCLPQRQNGACAAKNVSIPSLLCSTTKQDFKPLDDDTFSTKPLIGFASRYNRHYSEIWLTDYINTTRKKTQIRVAEETKPNEVDREGKTQIGSTTKDSSPETATIRTAGPHCDTNSLGQEIDRLTRTLNKANFACDSHVGRRHHVGEFDVQSATSHTSSIDTAEFSFEADFSKLAEQRCRIEAGVNATNLHDLQPQSVSDYTNVSNLSSASNVPSTIWDSDSHKDLFQPILTESYDRGDMMLYHESMVVSNSTQVHSELNCSRHSTSNTECNNCTIATDSEAISRECVVDDVLDIFDGRFELSFHDSHDGLYDTPLDQIHFSSEASHVQSDITASTAPVEDQHVNEEENVNGDACRKAKCVVVYDKCFSETERIFYDNVPATVKEMVDRLEVLRRLEADHAEKFGYKDFLPIQEEQKQEPHKMGEDDAKTFADLPFEGGGTHLICSVSYSFESESLLSVSPIEQTVLTRTIE